MADTRSLLVVLRSSEFVLRCGDRLRACGDKLALVTDAVVGAVMRPLSAASADRATFAVVGVRDALHTHIISIGIFGSASESADLREGLRGKRSRRAIVKPSLWCAECRTGHDAPGPFHALLCPMFRRPLAPVGCVNCGAEVVRPDADLCLSCLRFIAPGDLWAVQR